MHSSASVEASSTETAGWLWLLARWSLLTSLGALALTLVFLLGVGFDASVPPEYAELLQASRQPTVYRIAMVFDAVGWLLIGGVLLSFAGLARSHSPMRAAFLAACAIGQLAGSLGGFMRLDGTSALAAHYASASVAEQAVLQQSYIVLNAVIQSHFHAGQLLQGAGFLVAATVALGLVAFPRWLAFCIAIPGVTSSLVFVVQLVAEFSFPLLLLHILVGIIAVPFVLALTFWRESARQPGPAASTALVH